MLHTGVHAGVMRELGLISEESTTVAPSAHHHTLRQCGIPLGMALHHMLLHQAHLISCCALVTLLQLYQAIRAPRQVYKSSIGSYHIYQPGYRMPLMKLPGETIVWYV